MKTSSIVGFFRFTLDIPIPALRTASIIFGMHWLPSAEIAIERPRVEFVTDRISSIPERASLTLLSSSVSR